MNKKNVQKMCVTSFLIIVGCFLTSLVFSTKFSTKVSAIELSGLIDPASIREVGTFAGGTCKFYREDTAQVIESSISGISTCSLPSDAALATPYGLVAFRNATPQKFDTSKIYRVSFAVLSPAVSQNALPWNMVSYGDWKILEVQEDWTVSGTDYCSIYELVGHLNQFTCMQSVGNNSVTHYSVYMMTPLNNERYIGFGRYNTTIQTFYNISIAQFIRFDNIYEYTPITFKDEIAEAEQKTEQATNEGESNAQTSKSQNDSASQSLITTFGQVFGAFSTSASNCNLNMDLGNADFGTINLCSGKPAAISAILTPIGTIIMVYAIFLCSRSIFRLFVKISAFAQGGSSNG